MRPVAALKRPKMTIILHASNWLFVHTTHVDVAPEVLHAGSRLRNSNNNNNMLAYMAPVCQKLCVLSFMQIGQGVSEL